MVAKKAVQALQRDLLLALEVGNFDGAGVKRKDREGSEGSKRGEVPSELVRSYVSFAAHLSRTAPFTETAFSTPVRGSPRSFSSPIATPFHVTHPTSAPPPWPKSPYIGRFLAIDDTPLLVGNWSGVFYRREVKAGPLKGRKVFKETPIEQVVPEGVDVIHFAGLSGDLLVRMAGKESCWLVLPASGSRSEVDEWMDGKEREKELDVQSFE